MKDYILKQVARLRHERHLQEGLWLRHRRQGTTWEFWQEDAWGRRAKTWIITGVTSKSDQYGAAGLILELTSGSSKAHIYENRINWTMDQVRRVNEEL